MNPQWHDVRREHKPQHLKSILKKVPQPADDWRRYSQSLAPAVDKPATIQPGLDPVRGEAGLEVKRMDVELARKRRELEEIEERIMHKKVAIALRQTKPPVVESQSSGFHAGFDQSKGSSLRERVHRILQQRHPAGFLSQARSLKDRRNCAGSSVSGLHQKQHPLKIRVKELMKRRGCPPCPPERTVSDVTPSPAAQPPAEGGGVNVGFQRFLAVLNKGVDMDLLKRIVNDGCGASEPVEPVLNHNPTAAVAEPCIPPINGSKQSKSRDESIAGSCSHSLGSSSRSRSPPAMKKKPREEEKANATEQHKQLQNILNTLGLNLEVGEISRLANRTQERLYGTKSNHTNSDHHRKPHGEPRKDRNASSRSSSRASSLGSGSPKSGPRSVSPPCNRLARSNDSLLRTTSEHCEGVEEPPEHGAQTAHSTTTSRQPQQQNQAYVHSAPSSAYHSDSFPQYGQYDVHPSGYCNQTIGPYWPPQAGPHSPCYYPTQQPYQQSPYPPMHDPAAPPGGYYPQGVDMMEDMNVQMAPDWTESEWQMERMVRPRCLQEISTESKEESTATAPPQCLPEFGVQQNVCLKQPGVCSQSVKGNKAGQGKKANAGKQRQNRRLKLKNKKKKMRQQLATQLKAMKVMQAAALNAKYQEQAAVLKAKALAQEEADNSELVTLDDEVEGVVVVEEGEKQPQKEAKIKAKLRIKLKAFNERAKEKLALQANFEPATSSQSHPDLTD